MLDFQLRQTPSLNLQQSPVQIMRLEQAHLLEMSQEEFSRLIAEIEQMPIFQRLFRRDKIVGYQRFPKTDIASSFYRLREDMIADSGSIDVESLLLNKGHIVSQIQRIGRERFKRYFLFPDEGLSLDEIARACDLEVSEVREINSLISEFSIMSEFYHPSAITPGLIRYVKVASVERGGGGFVIGYFSPSLARGRYVVNYERFEKLKVDGVLTETEARKAGQLLRKLELINTRKNTLNLVLQSIIERQALYLESANPKSLLPFSQKELAQRIGLAASSVSRAVRGKSIDTPWGQEIPLKQFFPRTKTLKKGLLKQLLTGENSFPSDEAIRDELREKFGVNISRRSVAHLRKELGFSAAHGKRRLRPDKETK
jgi:DNA-directed RNA polymerase specialized sigma54-like protein